MTRTLSTSTLRTQKAIRFFSSFCFMAVNIYFYLEKDYIHERLGRTKDDPEVTRLLQGTFTHFTMWNLAIQELYFSLCCTEDLLQSFPAALSDRMKCKLRSIRRMILPIFLFPCSCEVTSNFWALYLYSPTLIFGNVDGAFPFWVNHVLHTIVGPIAALELYTRAQTEGIWNEGIFRDGAKLGVLFTFILVIVLGRYVKEAKWPYPMMDQMSAMELACTFVLNYVIGFLWFFVGRYLARKIESRQLKEEIITLYQRRTNSW